MNTGQFPSGFKLVIYRGTSGSIDLVFKTGGVAMNLTGKTFKAYASKTAGSTPFYEFTMNHNGLAQGTVGFSWLKSGQSGTTDLPIGKFTFGLIDSTGQLWIEDFGIVKDKTPPTF